MNLNHFIFSIPVKIHFFYFFYKIQGNINFFTKTSKLMIFKTSFVLMNENNSIIEELILYFDLKGFSKLYNCFMDINQNKYLFTRLKNSTNGKVLKIRTNSKNVMNLFEELFDDFN